MALLFPLLTKKAKRKRALLCFWSPALDPDGPTLPSHQCQQMPPPWWRVPPSQEHVPPEERVIQPPQPCLPGFCSSWYKSTGGRELCTYRETRSPGQPGLLQAERGSEGPALSDAAQQLPRRAFIFTVSEKQLSALRTLGNFCHICRSRSVIKMTEFLSGERDGIQRSCRAAVVSRALLFGRGNKTQIQKTKPPLITLSSASGKGGASSQQMSNQSTSPVPSGNTAAFWKGLAAGFSRNRIKPIRCKLLRTLVAMRHPSFKLHKSHFLSSNHKF